jgi:hypothetical protein
MAQDVGGNPGVGIWAGAELSEGNDRAARVTVEVAVDAPGASRSYDYAVPERLAPVESGEAVLVADARPWAWCWVVAPTISPPT